MNLGHDSSKTKRPDLACPMPYHTQRQYQEEVGSSVKLTYNWQSYKKGGCHYVMFEDYSKSIFGLVSMMDSMKNLRAISTTILSDARSHVHILSFSH